MNKVAQTLRKTAAYIAELEAENHELRSALSNYEFKENSGDTLTKISEVSGVGVDKTMAILMGMTSEQRSLFEKISNTNFSLGGASDVDGANALTAEEKFLAFMK
jgi:hypothetical protein